MCPAAIPTACAGHSARWPTWSSTPGVARRSPPTARRWRRSTRTRSRCARSRRSRPRSALRVAAHVSARRPALGGASRPYPRGACLLVRARVAVQRAALDGLVDEALEAHVVGVGFLLVAGRHRVLEVAEVGLDGGGVVAVLEALALAAHDALLLRVD